MAGVYICQFVELSEGYVPSQFGKFFSSDHGYMESGGSNTDIWLKKNGQIFFKNF